MISIANMKFKFPDSDHKCSLYSKQEAIVFPFMQVFELYEYSGVERPKKKIFV